MRSLPAPTFWRRSPSAFDEGDQDRAPRISRPVAHGGVGSAHVLDLFDGSDPHGTERLDASEPAYPIDDERRRRPGRPSCAKPVAAESRHGAVGVAVVVLGQLGTDQEVWPPTLGPRRARAACTGRSTRGEDAQQQEGRSGTGVDGALLASVDLKMFRCRWWRQRPAIAPVPEITIPRSAP